MPRWPGLPPDAASRREWGRGRNAGIELNGTPSGGFRPGVSLISLVNVTANRIHVTSRLIISLSTVANETFLDTLPMGFRP